MRSPQTHGDEWPGGSSARHNGSSGFNVTGGFPLVATQVLSGPRNCGHEGSESALHPVPAVDRTTATTIACLCIGRRNQTQNHPFRQCFPFARSTLSYTRL